MSLKTIADIDVSKESYDYNFQTYLTDKLDNLDWDFSQDILNEIILWKVNRYALFDEDTIELLNKLERNSKEFDKDFTIKLLWKLLNTKWVQLAMATTILRFKNPSTYQIIDQRVYRFIYWKEMERIVWKNNLAIKLYLDYLDKLREVCIKYNINFEESDRVLYALDKKLNKNVKIKY